MTGPGSKRTRAPHESDGQQGGAGLYNTALEKNSPPSLGLDGADDQLPEQSDRHAGLRSGVQFPMDQFNKPIKPTDINRRLELPPDAYWLNNEVSTDLFSVPMYNSISYSTILLDKHGLLKACTNN